MKPLTDSKRFVAFIKQRDQGLERVRSKYSVLISAIIGVLSRRAEEVAAHMATTGALKNHLKLQRDQFERALTPYFDAAIQRTIALITAMRKTTYIVSMAGQAEAIGRTLGKQTRYEITKKRIGEIAAAETPFGGALHLRIELGYHRMLRDVVDAFQLSQVMDSEPKETIERIKRAFPSGQMVSMQRRVMAKMTEARKPLDKDPVELSTGVIDEADWNQAVEDYLSEELPFGRAPNDKIFYFEYDDSGDLIEKDSYFRYSWELEKELTDDFIDQVRNGENDAATQNGIDEFQWIAVVDNKTDECCLIRDGLTLTEIEDTISDDCDDGAPPVHPNCRCRVAPMTKDWPDETPPSFSDFDSWIESKE